MREPPRAEPTTSSAAPPAPPDSPPAAPAGAVDASRPAGVREPRADAQPTQAPTAAAAAPSAAEPSAPAGAPDAARAHEPEPAPAPRATGGSPSATARAAANADSGAFLALPGTSYVLELAHSANAAELDAVRAAVHPDHGALYEVRVTRDGGDWWLLLWGSFDSVDAARAARAELPADAAINAGWPRRVAPLQAEAHRTGG
jgi:DamX protein